MIKQPNVQTIIYHVWALVACKTEIVMQEYLYQSLKSVVLSRRIMCRFGAMKEIICG